MDLHYANSLPYINELEPELANSWLEIRLDTLGKNIDYLRSLLPQGKKMMAVVKADAYGHGSIEVSVKAQKKNINYLGVATIAEAKILRQAGVTLPILVLGSVFPEQIHIALKFNIETTISSIESIKNLNNIATALNLKAKAHLKIDSGMGRVGVRPEKLNDLINFLQSSEKIELKGIFTHFAESENPNQDFTKQQIQTFKEGYKKVKEAGFKDFITHAANSSGILCHPDSCFDMVRTGLAMYGVGDPQTPHLTQVLSLKSRIINLKEVPKGNSLGYGRSFFTIRDSLIGIIPIGYADGFPRILSNKQDVLIKGKRCRVVGNISMDQCLVDITDIENIKIGEEVILQGSSGNESIKAEEWAEKSYRIPYEVLCGFGNRLPRVYIDTHL